MTKMTVKLLKLLNWEIPDTSLLGGCSLLALPDSLCPVPRRAVLHRESLRLMAQVGDKRMTEEAFLYLVCVCVCLCMSVYVCECERVCV